MKTEYYGVDVFEYPTGNEWRTTASAYPDIEEKGNTITRKTVVDVFLSSGHAEIRVTDTLIRKLTKKVDVTFIIVPEGMIRIIEKKESE